ncbi:hypothetical protein [Candidatus Thiosymbion oneisti]|uniref:hypothetical protein n=1 Tax=Candidatus Thiosymbion oneisti TaxID=589554 RepID=UPI00105C75AC|nr:hypothetical protein [Candidatus Thiosymbion oneisti]
MLRRVYPWVIVLCICFVLLELGLYFLAKYGNIPTLFPTYSWGNREGFHFDLDKHFGVWHKPNSSFIHRRQCFSVKYYFNSYGARDKERTKNSKEPRAVVIGDSFVEGYGLDADKRLSDILERATGMEHLNFGTSGHFGLTQEALLYETLAIDFEHDVVLIGMLPDNDFINDDIDIGKRAFRDRYRPYYVGNYPDYKITYLGNRPSLESVINRDFWGKIKSFLREYTFTYNTLSYIKGMLSYKRAIEENKDSSKKGTYTVYSDYYDYKRHQFMRARFSIEKIVGLASDTGKSVVLFTIPVYRDFLRYRDNPSPPPLHIELEALSKEIGFEYLDLLPFMFEAEKDWGRFFHTCDFHWNAVGNKKAAEIILENSIIYKEMEKTRMETRQKPHVAD